MKGVEHMISDLYVRQARINQSSIPEPRRYPFTLPVIRHIHQIDFKSKVTFFVGENGTGKSTLLEAIAANFGFNPEGGSRNFNFSTQASHSELYEYMTLVKGARRPKDGFFLRAESFYNVATEVDQLAAAQSYGGKSLHAQSHGESFMSLLLHRFWGDGFYILDEPEAALSPSRQFSLIARMDQLVKQNSQFIIATHSPILLAYPGADIYVLSEEGLTQTPYESTEHYLLTKAFLNNPQGILGELID
ncbi:AAA family ATPase [Paenibacillus graminis]|nr:AAA family ATPase [Paenibacillus graminis]